ncbi:hypothetical protein MMC07_009163 [Pseudocyphellaria aurata]|nr:hypothetical protein [Pseudocyphellaria aurata]
MVFCNVICDPTLGQPTIIPSHQQTVNFTVLIESNKTFPEQHWEAVLWHNGHEDREWRGLPLEELSSDTVVRPLAVSFNDRPNIYRRYFTIGLQRPREQDSVQFTLKYRTCVSESWKWVNDQSSLKDGELFFQTQNAPQELGDYLKNYSSTLTVRSVTSEALDTQSWFITNSVQAAQGKVSGYSSVSLGTPCKFTRWFSLVRLRGPWLVPRHGQGNFSPVEDVVLCSFLRWDGLHLVLLAVSGVDDDLTVFKPDGHGNVIIFSRNDSTKEGLARVVVAVGKTFESANAAVMYYARKLVNGDESNSVQEKTEMEGLNHGKVKVDWMESWSDGLTYCTWNGLGQDLNEQKIYHALDELNNNGIKITNLIIDDNWQSIDNPGQNQAHRGMTDFEANKEGFPQGLQHTVTQIRKKHSNIQHVAVWHALLGYWGGISPTGNIAKIYKTQQVRQENDSIITVVDVVNVQRWYNDFYTFLSKAGVDSIKTDNQCMVDAFDDAYDRRNLIKAYQDAWMINHLQFFSANAISCMSQAPQIIFHSQLPTNRPRIMVRNSDDFYPDIPTSHPWHVFANAHNSLLTCHLNILPDWDMFQTSHEYSSFHAAARCVSGGPIYFTDEPGKHDVDLIAQMTARTTQGKTVILRPSVVGKTTGVYAAYEEEQLLKVGSFTGSKRTGTGILGVFNVSTRVLSGFVNLNEFPGVEKNEEYVIRGHTTGEISKALKLDDKNAVVLLEVAVRGWEILSAYPLRSFTLGRPGNETSTIKMALLGLLGKMTGAAAVLNSESRVEEGGRLRIVSSIKAVGVLGALTPIFGDMFCASIHMLPPLPPKDPMLTTEPSLGIYISDLATRSIEDTMLITILGRVIPLHTVSIDPARPVLQVDIERAWNEMGLDGGWSNEVSVEIFIS